MILDLIILVLLAILAYVWVGFPIALALLARGERSLVSGHRSVAKVDVPLCHDPCPDLCRQGSGQRLEEQSTGHRPPSALAILFAAHNEEDHIATRLDNLLECIGQETTDHGPQTTILVGLDACTDGTAEIAHGYADEHPEIHVHEFPERRGKVAVLKDLVRETTADILVFTDANTGFAPDALARLLAPLADPTVGGVCGKLILQDSDSRKKAQKAQKGDACRNSSAEGGRRIPTRACLEKGRGRWETSSKPTRAESGDFASEAPDSAHSPFCVSLRLFAAKHSPAFSPEGRYWELENWMKERESALDSCLGANGAIYAMRRELFWEEIPDNTIIDDFVLGMKVREQGPRFVYEPLALAMEELPEQAHEWTRRTRIGAGAYQALKLCRHLLFPVPLCVRAEGGKLKAEDLDHSPLSGFRFHPSALLFPWMFWSHKVLRWLTPHVLLLLLLLAVFGALRCQHGGLSVYCPLSTVLLAAAALTMAAVLITRLGGVRRLRRCRCLRPLLLLDHFVTMQVALFAGFLRYCRGSLGGAWERTPRGRE